MTEEEYDKYILDTVDPGCDIYMCVTDVLWKYEPRYGFDKVFFLDCDALKNKGKISYAVSRGPSQYTQEQEEEFFDHLKTFHFISCREKSLYDYITPHRKASIVLDPVFLHEPAFYDSICVKPKEEHYVLVYTVMQKSHHLIRAACEFAESKGLAVIDVSDDINILYGRKRFPRRNRYDCSIEEWLGYIRHADYVFTNSFHGTCFSILFHKAFFTGGRKGDKVDWLQELFGLSWRRIGKDIGIMDQPIPWEKVDKLREQYKKSSEEFLLNAIRETEKALQDPGCGAGNAYGIEVLLQQELPDLHAEEGILGKIRNKFGF